MNWNDDTDFELNHTGTCNENSLRLYIYDAASEKREKKENKNLDQNQQSQYKHVQHYVGYHQAKLVIWYSQGKIKRQG